MVFHVVQETQKWTLRLAEFNFTVEHISGETNIWANLLIGWATGNINQYRRSCAFLVPLLTEESPELPSMKTILKAQKKDPPSDANVIVTTFEENIDVWYSNHGKL